MSQDAEQPTGSDIFGAPWPEDPRLQEQQELGEPDAGPAGDPQGQEAATEPSADTQPFDAGLPAAASSPAVDHEPARSAIKVTKTTRGTTWEIRVMAGDSEQLLNEARALAVKQYQALERELP